MRSNRNSQDSEGTLNQSLADRELRSNRNKAYERVAGAAHTLGHDHGVTKALARASITMDKADLWRARLAVKTLRRDQREAIAEAAES